jgi:hypothetical protein
MHQEDVLTGRDVPQVRELRREPRLRISNPHTATKAEVCLRPALQSWLFAEHYVANHQDDSVSMQSALATTDLVPVRQLPLVEK